MLIILLNIHLKKQIRPHHEHYFLSFIYLNHDLAETTFLPQWPTYSSWISLLCPFSFRLCRWVLVFTLLEHSYRRRNCFSDIQKNSLRHKVQHKNILNYFPSFHFSSKRLMGDKNISTQRPPTSHINASNANRWIYLHLY